MTTSPKLRLAASTLFLSLAASVCHAAADTDDSDRISRLNDEAAQLRTQAEAKYQAIEPECHTRFLVNSCIDAAKQERLDAIRKARALESEARKLDLAQRQRAAAEAMRENAGAPQSASAPSPAGDAVIRPQPEAERLRNERAREATTAERDARTARATQDAERASERSKAAEAAAQRAEQAARERARYEERIREYEEKKARDAAGR